MKAVFAFDSVRVCLSLFMSAKRSSRKLMPRLNGADECWAGPSLMEANTISRFDDQRRYNEVFEV